MAEAWSEALRDSLPAVPLLFVIYLFLELAERKLEGPIKRRLAVSSAAGPFWGAVLGCIPQCGFSVIATVLFIRRIVSPGTLLAVYLSTSDEAIPVILAQPARTGVLVPLIATKIVLAVAAGYAVDLFIRHAPHPSAASEKADEITCHDHCCGDRHAATEPWWKTFVLSPLRHTAKIFFFMLAAAFVLNALVAAAGQERLGAVLLAHPLLQPFAAVLVGLIPNCAASVVITEMFLKGGIGFGSAIAGLSASAGLGTLVLIRENKNPRETALILALLAGISFLGGCAINLIFYPG